MPFLLLFFSCSLAWATPAVVPASSFELVDEESGIQLYERWHKTAEGNAYRELKTVLKVKAGASALLRTLREEQQAGKWMRRVDEVRSFPGQHERHWYAYVHYGLPWPARDHDCTIAYRQVAGTVGLTTIRFESVVLKNYPVKDGIERITGLSGRWEFQELGNGQTEVHYFIQTTKASSIPRFITDPIVRSNMMRTMEGFREVAEQL
ncbi:MAG: hypothetical protein RIC19_22530 [Phaeodactylibacter sp.]|uniref:hypothetical protein n=1 Tax=Phaeodactylibacter sp. TaxID=1940289 RepID=UPI0032EBD3E8